MGIGCDIQKIISASDLSIIIDFGSSEPGGVLQRWDGEAWRHFKQDGKQVVYPLDYKTLPPGRYRLRSKESNNQRGLIKGVRST